jgi:hypothetical protein
MSRASTQFWPYYEFTRVVRTDTAAEYSTGKIVCLIFGQMACRHKGKEARTSFLKKRSKKLLLVLGQWP